MNLTNDPALKNMTAECRQTVIDITEQCKKHSGEMLELMFSKDYVMAAKCTSKSDDKSDIFKACTPDQKQKYLDIFCPVMLNFTECFMPAKSCFDERSTRKEKENSKNLVIECASYKNGDSQGLSFMMPWTLFLLFLF
jgi:hypothetical protein